MMEKRYLAFGVAAFAGIMFGLAASGCFTSPTSPTPGMSNLGSQQPQQPQQPGGEEHHGVFPTPTPAPIEPTGTASISGTVAQAPAAYVWVYAVQDSSHYFDTIRYGDGEFVFENVPDGTYDVYAVSGTLVSNHVEAVVVDGVSVGTIELVLQ